MQQTWHMYWSRAQNVGTGINIKGTLTRKKCFKETIWGFLSLQYELLLYLKIFWSSVSKLRSSAALFYRCTNLLTCGHGQQINVLPGAGLNFLADIRYAHTRFKMCVVYHLQITILLEAAMGTLLPPIFHLRSAPPQERKVKMYKLVFFWWYATCHRLFTEICGLPPKFIMGSKE
jgi:hypothetical protein